jgi:sugar fermentation stimulation protein A
VDVETPGGETLTVHCPNPGSMRGFIRPGAAVRCSTSDNPKRKLRHTLEMMRIGRVWVGLHTSRANHVVAKVLEAGAVPSLRGYSAIRREVRVDDRTRLDFALDGRERGGATAYLEVKSVTLAEGSVARFPDSVTERGRRHLETLARLHQQGHRAVLLYLVQRADCDRVEPADDIDPEYGAALRAAAKAGVELIALGARVTAREIIVERSLPVVL